MGRFGINDDYPGPSSYASPSDYAGPSSFAGPSDYAGTSSPAGPSVSSEQDDEPEADSMLNNEHVDSEPDEVEVEGLTTNNPENNDEVSIEVMIDVLGTLSHDSGWRTGILTTNMSECVNGVLKGARRLPIVAIVQITFHRSVRYFLERTTRCHRMLNANQEWADFAFRIFEARQAEAVHHIVQNLIIINNLHPF
ncbi:UNVERIFIED_CONTAM: hypothetical protein Sradi_1144700 [Sesamum radiatum]|uniref:Uncharacterized protein n=1 Tax=Sesamum radiatum TaxID=300843 RepID=A0AAW2V8Q0_SESRA